MRKSLASTSKVLFFEPEVQQFSVDVRDEKRGGAAVEHIDEDIELEALPLIVHFSVSQKRPPLNVEGPDAGVDDTFGACVPPAEFQSMHAVRGRVGLGEVVVETDVQLRLGAALVRERWVRCLELIRDIPDRSRQRVLCEDAG